MRHNKPTMRAPELLVFARPLVVGFIGGEIFRTSFYLGSSFNSRLPGSPAWATNLIVLAGVILCLFYAFNRGAHKTAVRIGRSLRLDLLLVICIGIYISVLSAEWLSKFHDAIKSASPYWAPTILLLLGAMLLSPLFQQYWPKRKRSLSQHYFISDEEIENEDDNLLLDKSQARSFAETVLESGAIPGLVFGVDGPWGVGKTSFINLSERYWEIAQDRVIVCRFESFRYASEPDLSSRLINDLSAAIQKRVYAPEFRPVASRYSRLIRGKADFSFFGLKLSLDPSHETIDELLDDIDEVLMRIERRAIIVIDDLDRLDAKTINNVLFATRRTFKLTQATYILCYDTEVLVGNQDEDLRAREFLEKFVTVKLSLFVDSSSIRDFLKNDWQSADRQLGSIPSDTMIKLGSVLNELADILDGDKAANYMPLVGNFRKVKRFVNSMLLMQIEKSDLGRTDFDKRDLINLMLIHLNYPGLFRRIYVEESEGRCGAFSVRCGFGEQEFKNTGDFAKLVEKQPESAKFLLKELFDVGILQLGNRDSVPEPVFRSRACFNSDINRNLEAYLKLIVRFVTPEPQTTFVHYQNAVLKVLDGVSIASVLGSQEFSLINGEHSHDQFWRVLTNQSSAFTAHISRNAIEALIDYLPRYSAIEIDGTALRERMIYSLARLLNQSSHESQEDFPGVDNPDTTVDIAQHIFGEKSYQDRGIIDQLVKDDRGVLGWNDIMLFRLLCSADRNTQLYNLHSALILHQDRNAETAGLVSELALMGMRELSQEIFKRFKREFINSRRNFFAEVNQASSALFLGDAYSLLDQQDNSDVQLESGASDLKRRIDSMRFVIKNFVIYQLCNRLPPNGSGVGCGLYDETGNADGGGIAMQMNNYVFDFCFNPDVENSNYLLFLDCCLSHLSNPAFWGQRTGGYFPTKRDLPGGLDPYRMGRYWSMHKVEIHSIVDDAEDRIIVTSRYTASYSTDLPAVFEVLDQLASDSEPGESVVVPAV